jgi:hypothetical protein
LVIFAARAWFTIMILFTALALSVALFANSPALARDKQTPPGPSDSSAQKEIGSIEAEKLIRQLGSHNYGEREAAERKLGTIGKPALIYLRKAAMDQTDPELRTRIQGLIDRLIDRLGRDRDEFAKLVSLIKEGMTDGEVMRILGKPDDIRAGDEVNYNASEEWCYGTEGHMSFPTLGTVCFERLSGRKSVLFVFGGKSTPPPRSLFTEGELRKLLIMLDHRKHQRGLWDPAWAIQVVNTLQPLGERKALAAMEEYARVMPSPFPQHRTDLSLLLRILFDVPKDPGYMPKCVYPFGLRDPKDPRVPRYPILILGDVPLQIGFGTGSASGDPPPTFAEQAAFFRDHMTFRAKLLQPTDKPLELYSQRKGYHWLYRNYVSYGWPSGEQIAEEIRDEIHRLVMTVYRGDIEHGTLPRPVRWDMKRNMYTFLDGTTLSGQFGQRREEEQVTGDSDKEKQFGLRTAVRGKSHSSHCHVAK